MNSAGLELSQVFLCTILVDSDVILRIFSELHPCAVTEFKKFLLAALKT